MDAITVYVIIIIVVIVWYMRHNVARFLGGPQDPLFSAPPGPVGVPDELYNPKSSATNSFLGGPQDPLFSAPMGPAGVSRNTYLTPIPVSAQY